MERWDEFKDIVWEGRVRSTKVGKIQPFVAKSTDGTFSAGLREWDEIHIEVYLGSMTTHWQSEKPFQKVEEAVMCANRLVDNNPERIKHLAERIMEKATVRRRTLGESRPTGRTKNLVIER